jgi:hypothetical protein
MASASELPLPVHLLSISSLCKQDSFDSARKHGTDIAPTTSFHSFSYCPLEHWGPSWIRPSHAITIFASKTILNIHAFLCSTWIYSTLFDVQYQRQGVDSR